MKFVVNSIFPKVVYCCSNSVPLVDPRPTEGPIKSLLSFCQFFCLSICMSIRQFDIFLRNGSLVFSDFWYVGRQMEYLKTDSSLFPRKIPKRTQNGPKMGFLDFLKNFFH